MAAAAPGGPHTAVHARVNSGRPEMTSCCLRRSTGTRLQETTPPAWSQNDSLNGEKPKSSQIIQEFFFKITVAVIVQDGDLVLLVFIVLSELFFALKNNISFSQKTCFW